MTAVHELAGFAETLSLDDVPPGVVSKVAALWVDHVGTVFGGMRIPEVRSIVRLVRDRRGAGRSTVLGEGFSTSESDAAFCNGAAADVLEHQDGYRFGGFHPSHTMPALLAVAERVGADLRALYEATIVAYEVANRLGRATHPQATERGWFPFVASYGAAAGCARLLGLDARRIADALGTTAFFAPAIMIDGIFAGPSSKPVFAGQIARAGVEASLHAEAGLTGWHEAVDSDRGLVALLGGDSGQLARSLADLGSGWTIPDVHQKRFAGCRHTHGAAQACIEIARENDLRPEEVSEVDVEVYDVAKLLVSRPVTPTMGTVGATLSLPYVVGAAVVDRDVVGAQYGAERVDDPVIQGVARKVRVRSSADLNELYPAYTATRVTISTAAGDAFVQTVDVPAGDYRAPLSRQDLLDKFATYTAYRLDEERRDTVVDLLMGHHLDHTVSAVVERLG